VTVTTAAARRPRRARLLAAALAAVAVGGLAGCQSDPTAAVTIDDESLSVELLDDATSAFCGYLDEVQTQAVARTTVRAVLTQAWIFGTALESVAAEEGIEDLFQGNPQTAAFSEEIQSTGAGEEAADEASRLLAVLDVVDATAQQAAVDELAERDVRVNPSVAGYEDGLVTLDGDEISVAVSDVARQGQVDLTASPDLEAVSALPADQRCGVVPEQLGAS